MKKALIYIVTLVSFTVAFSQQSDLLYHKNGLKIYKDSAFFKNTELYNAKKKEEELKEKEETTECPVQYFYYYNPLSLVGAIYSYEMGEFGETACGVPGGSVHVVTINLTTTKKVALTDLFTEASILKALKNDSWVQKEVKQRNNHAKSIIKRRGFLPKDVIELPIDLEKITSFSEFLKKINHHPIGLKFTSDSFTIVNYDNVKKRVAIRWVGMQYMGSNHHRHLQLGLWLTPKKEAIQYFTNKDNFYLHRFKNGLKK